MSIFECDQCAAQCREYNCRLGGQRQGRKPASELSFSASLIDSASRNARRHPLSSASSRTARTWLRFASGTRNSQSCRNASSVRRIAESSIRCAATSGVRLFDVNPVLLKCRRLPGFLDGYGRNVDLPSCTSDSAVGFRPVQRPCQRPARAWRRRSRSSSWAATQNPFRCFQCLPELRTIDPVAGGRTISPGHSLQLRRHVRPVAPFPFAAVQTTNPPPKYQSGSGLSDIATSRARSPGWTLDPAAKSFSPSPNVELESVGNLRGKPP